MQEISICNKCKNFITPELKFKARVRNTRDYCMKNFLFNSYCFLGIDKKVMDSIILECNYFKEEGK